jgi:hypothetical protein
VIGSLLAEIADQLIPVAIAMKSSWCSHWCSQFAESLLGYSVGLKLAAELHGREDQPDFTPSKIADLP